MYRNRSRPSMDGALLIQEINVQKRWKFALKDTEMLLTLSQKVSLNAGGRLRKTFYLNGGTIRSSSELSAIYILQRRSDLRSLPACSDRAVS
ncbi:hypothetical protein AVEN_118330-1 [Araneus ventricosus]|uniref:Uncharacterized protein n=1 Tax=Araneus ventricosus TaxID=182803 RepID=A0A4Y2B7K3_ARAVE|nr:hypothetical protein AVEN_118330-1 [Araneus ventricosus]